MLCAEQREEGWGDTKMLMPSARAQHQIKKFEELHRD
jgi:hypothetical protein